MKNRYKDLNSHLRSIFSCRVQKIAIDAGLNCPNRDGAISSGGCIYCNARGSGTGAHAQGQSITEQIDKAKAYLTKRYKAKKFIAYFQSFSNTYAPVSRLKDLYEEAIAVEDVVGLSIGTRPDCIDTDILNLLQEFARKYLIWVEYGLQSANDTTLAAINRGHDVRCFQEAVQATAGRGIKICAHVILGLPGEQRADMLHTAKRVASLSIDGVKLHLLYVVKGTPLERLYQQGAYHCLDQREYIDLVCDFLERIRPDMIIQRLTGDPHRNELVAPKWSLNKSETLTKIRQTLEKRDSWQGKHFNQRRRS
jgi:radical SAM protein (TIGR01212 family)